MPTYNHECQNQECCFHWEDMYSIVVEPPKVCPKCNQETAKRVISDRGSPSKDIVELSGQELIDRAKADAKQMKKDMAKDEKIYANLLGESRYQSLQQQMDKRKRG